MVLIKIGFFPCVLFRENPLMNEGSLSKERQTGKTDKLIDLVRWLSILVLAIALVLLLIL